MPRSIETKFTKLKAKFSEGRYDTRYTYSALP